ncbi:MAG: hypothetical protein U0703_17765 [Anaerolineae bacterium]
MAVYQIKPVRETLHGYFSRNLPPVLKIQSGDTVQFQTLEATGISTTARHCSPILRCSSRLRLPSAERTRALRTGVH